MVSAGVAVAADAPSLAQAQAAAVVHEAVVAEEEAAEARAGASLPTSTRAAVLPSATSLASSLDAPAKKSLVRDDLHVPLTMKMRTRKNRPQFEISHDPFLERGGDFLSHP
jgi:hypothetical protein